MGQHWHQTPDWPLQQILKKFYEFKYFFLTSVFNIETAKLLHFSTYGKYIWGENLKTWEKLKKKKNSKGQRDGSVGKSLLLL